MGKFKELKPIFSFTEWATKWAKWATKWAIIIQDLKVILNSHNHLSFGNETHPLFWGECGVRESYS